MDKQIIIDGIKLHGNRKDLTGLKVGKLTCLKPVKTEKNKNSEWLCECECGNFKIAQTYRLLSGRIQSCGDCYHTINHYIPMIKELEKQLKAKEQECERLKQGYAELTDIVSPYMDDFTGYNEELGGFDIMLCIKQLLEQLDQLKVENENLKAKLIGWLDKKGITRTEKEILEQCIKTLIEIKEIAQYDVYTSSTDLCLKLNWIKKRISECEGNNDLEN